MPKRLKPGERLGDLEIDELITSGSTAIIYRAKAPDGAPVFLKQYKSPTLAPPNDSWYYQYIDYMDEMQRRIEASSARHYCVGRLAAFESDVGGRAYYQAYEFIENGASLEDLLSDREHPHAKKDELLTPELRWR